MSWDAFIENFLMEKQRGEDKLQNCCEAAAIMSRVTGQVWACTRNFNLREGVVEWEGESGQKRKLRVNEAKEIVEMVKNHGLVGRVGVRVGGVKYEMVKNNQEVKSLYFRKANGGMCVAVSRICIIIASYDEKRSVLIHGTHEMNQNPGLCNDRVEKLAEFLSECGF